MVPAGGKCPGTRPYLPPTWTRPRKLRGLGRSRVGEWSGETKRQETARSARPRDARGPASSAPIASDATSEPNAFGPNEDYYYESPACAACAMRPVKAPCHSLSASIFASSFSLVSVS